MERELSLISTHETITLDTELVYPPIPNRSHDWSAIDANTFDADWNSEEHRYFTRCPQGAGRTEAEAIEDLIDQLEELL